MLRRAHPGESQSIHIHGTVRQLCKDKAHLSRLTPLTEHHSHYEQERKYLNLSLNFSFKQHSSAVGPLSMLGNKRFHLIPKHITKYPSRIKLRSVIAGIRCWSVSLVSQPVLWFTQIAATGLWVKNERCKLPLPNT